ncbi:MAG: FAD-binding protein [Deltaproteobacteria bacterium]|nr:MAG: FAD-binding protein [Deltaproteobacteria bacterium]
MALLLRDIKVPADRPAIDPAVLVAECLGLPPKRVRGAEIRRRSVDARRKPRLFYILTVAFEADDEAGLLRRHSSLARLEPPTVPEIVSLANRPSVVVVGMGPAGLFAALDLARAGAGVTLLERGRPVERRIRDVERFWKGGGLDAASNVQFGEGGAGTFSDGKLTTRINHPDIRRVLQTLVDCGAPADILIDAKPHIGSDRLRAVLIRFRRLLQDLGVDIRFESCLTDIELNGARVAGAIVNGSESLTCDALVLAPGHSARDTYAMLERRGVRLESKAFAVGLRVAHPAELINRIQYGAPRPVVGAADYRLAWNDPETGRGVYSFCMCPGGEIINASSEPGGLVVNGMSRRRRNAPWSNSALVVSVGPEDFGPGVLDGVGFQRRLEQRAWHLGGGSDRAPAQNLLAFLGQGRGPVPDVCRPGVVEADLKDLLPPDLVPPLRRGIRQFDRKMRGFVTADAVLVGVESRTSAPVRILRGENGASVSHPGLFPAGEGAGYAGGIMSAALDGIRAAGSIMKYLSAREEM